MGKSFLAYLGRERRCLHFRAVIVLGLVRQDSDHGERKQRLSGETNSVSERMVNAHRRNMIVVSLDLGFPETTGHLKKDSNSKHRRKHEKKD